jgi:hypothetical protein
MKIYFGHSSNIDYKKLYNLIKNLKLEHNVILPHDISKEPFSSKELMKDIDLFVAEVSMPSTGLGIELAWAKDTGIKIVMLRRKGSKFSDCLKFISNNFIEYKDEKDFIEKFLDIINQQ